MKSKQYILYFIIIFVSACKPSYEKCRMYYGKEAEKDLPPMEVRTPVRYDSVSLVFNIPVFKRDTVIVETKKQGRAVITNTITADKGNTSISTFAECLPDTVTVIVKPDCPKSIVFEDTKDNDLWYKIVIGLLLAIIVALIIKSRWV